MTETKITKAMVLATIKANVENMVFDGEVSAEDVIAYCDKTVEQAVARNEKAKARRAEKKVENPLKAIVLNVLTNEFMTGDDIVAAIGDPEVTKSKIVPQLTALVKDGVVEKDMIKAGTRKITAYRLITNEDAE